MNALHITLLIILGIVLIIISIIFYKVLTKAKVNTPNITKIVALYEDINYKGKSIELDEGTYNMNDIKNLNYTGNSIGRSIFIKPGYIVRYVYSPAIIVNDETRQVFSTAGSMANVQSIMNDPDNKITNVNNISSIEVSKHN